MKDKYEDLYTLASQIQEQFKPLDDKQEDEKKKPVGLMLKDTKTGMLER